MGITWLNECDQSTYTLKIKPFKSSPHIGFWLVVLGFNATLTAKAIISRSLTHMCFLAFIAVLAIFSFQSHRLLFLHALAEVGSENTPERKFTSTGFRTHNHQVMSPARSRLNNPGWATSLWSIPFILERLNERRQTASTLFQSYHCDSSHIYVFPGFTSIRLGC